MENKCPHCGKEMPKSSAFCMYCMRGLDEKDYVFKTHRKGNKKALILCACAVAVAIIGTAVFLAVGHKRVEAVSTSTPVPSSTSAATTTTATTTEKKAKTTKKQTTKKQTTKKQATKKAAATQAPAAEEPQYQPKQPATKAPGTTAASTQVVIDGSVLTDYPDARTNSSYTIPYSVTSIAGNAFHGNPYLRTLKFSKRTTVSCNWSNLFANLPNLETIYIYTGTDADTEGMQYFDGEIIYYYD